MAIRKPPCCATAVRGRSCEPMDDIPFAGRGVVYITRWKAEGFLQLVENVPVASRIFLAECAD